MPPIAVDEHTVATALSVSVHWLRKDRVTDRIVPFFKIGRSVRYNLDRVRETLVEQGGPLRKAMKGRV
jgi:hypothetical protein